MTRAPASGWLASRPTLRFVVVFVLTVVIAFGIEIHPWVDAHAVTPFISAIADASAWLIRLFGGQAESSQSLLRDPVTQFAIRISNGCSGIEATILLVAAVAAYPARWPQQLAGCTAGIVAIMAMNLVRIISLFYIGQHSREWFDWAHLYAWELLIMLDGVLVYLAWLRWLAPGGTRQALAS